MIGSVTKNGGRREWKLMIGSVTKNGGRREMETFDNLCYDLKPPYKTGF